MDEQDNSTESNKIEGDEEPAEVEQSESEQADASETDDELETAEEMPPENEEDVTASTDDTAADTPETSQQVVAAEEEGGADEVPADELEEKSQEPGADVLDQIVLAETAPDESALDEESEAVSEPTEDPAGSAEAEPLAQEALIMPGAAATQASAQAAITPVTAKSGGSYWAYLFTAVVGAFLGVVLTLTLLVIMNGTLRFNESAQIRSLEEQTNRSLATAEAEQVDLASEVINLDERIEIVATIESETADTLIIIRTDIDSLSGDFAALQTEADELDERLIVIDERLLTVAASAENFEAFLKGLRTLLTEVEGGTPEATETAGATGTVEGVPSKAATTEPTATVLQPTRTPRPTATPLIPSATSPTPTR